MFGQAAAYESLGEYDKAAAAYDAISKTAGKQFAPLGAQAVRMKEQLAEISEPVKFPAPKPKLVPEEGAGSGDKTGAAGDKKPGEINVGDLIKPDSGDTTLPPIDLTPGLPDTPEKPATPDAPEAPEKPATP